ncbi:MAG: tyrosine-type recombinase/integrase, partial [Symploca sp. SIO1A3]|nr:tyrosine-type recombinase/integrase [Symploca sp. SIO1A3]
IKSLVKLARSAGKCDYTLEEVKGEKVQVYRDTAGISRELYRKVLALPDRVELKGKRDYALLRLLWDNALRRGEIANANISDFDAEAKTLKIRGKGKGTVFEVIDLSLTTTEAIRDWLLGRRELNTSAPLFISVDPVKKGNRITGAGIYWIVQQYCRAAGVSKQMSPHRIRHSSITAALDATNGNVRKVQKLSRHAQIDTLMVYDDNRSKDQLEISTLLADMV